MATKKQTSATKQAKTTKNKPASTRKAGGKKKTTGQQTPPTPELHEPAADPVPLLDFNGPQPGDDDARSMFVGETGRIVTTHGRHVYSPGQPNSVVGPELHGGATNVLSRGSAEAGLQQLRNQQILTRSLSYSPDSGLDVLRAYGRNPFMRDRESIEMLLSLIPMRKEDSIRGRLEKLRRQLSGAASLGENTYKVHETHLDGNYHFSSLMSDYLYELVGRRTTMPLGDLSSLPMSRREKLKAYTQMIADRYMGMSTLNYVSTELADNAKVMAELGIQIPAMNQIAKDLERATQAAKIRYMQSNIIQPLFRDVLFNRSEVKDLTEFDPLSLVWPYTQWLRLFKMRTLQEPVFRYIVSDMSQRQWINQATSLRDIAAVGYDVPFYYAMSTLAGTIEEHNALREDWFVDIEDDDDANCVTKVDVRTPLLSFSRTASIRNVHGEALILNDDINDVAYSNISMSVMMELIQMYSRVLGKEIVEEIDIDFITRRPEWSGLIGTRVMTKENASDEVSHFLRPLVFAEFMSSLMKADYVDVPLMALFNEPNRADIQKSMAENLYIYALATRSVRRVLENVLSIARESLEWKYSPIWAELDKIGLSVPKTGDFRKSYHQFTETLVASRPMVLSENGAFHTVQYFIDDNVEGSAQFPLELRAMLESNGALGVRITETYQEFPFRTSSLNITDLSRVMESSLPTLEKKKLLDDMKVTDLASLPPTHNIFDKPFTVKAIDEDFGVREVGSGSFYTVLGVVRPRLIVTNSALELDEQLPVRYLATQELETALAKNGSKSVIISGTEVSADILSTVNDLAITEDFIKSFGAQVFLAADPSNYITVVRDVVQMPSYAPHFILPTSIEQFKRVLFGHEHSLPAPYTEGCNNDSDVQSVMPNNVTATPSGKDDFEV